MKQKLFYLESQHFVVDVSSNPGYISGFISPTLQIECKLNSTEACAIVRSAILNLSKLFALDLTSSEHSNWKTLTSNPALLVTFELFQYHVRLLMLFGYHQPNLIKILSTNDLVVQYIVSATHPTLLHGLYYQFFKTLETISMNSDGSEMSLSCKKIYNKSSQILSRNKYTGSNKIHFMNAISRHQLNIELEPLDAISFGYGKNRQTLLSSSTKSTSLISARYACNKPATLALLKKSGLPVPISIVATSLQQIYKFRELHQQPLVVKPVNQEQGRGVSCFLETLEDIKTAFDLAKSMSNEVVAEIFYFGDDYRFFVFNGKIIKCMLRKPGGVYGDGILSVEELVLKYQASTLAISNFRREGKHRLCIDSEALRTLGTFGLNASYVPKINQFVPLRFKSNVSCGGTSSLVSDLSDVHPDNISLMIRAASTLGLDFAGIDFITPDLSKSWSSTNSILCEINSLPQIGFSTSKFIFNDIVKSLHPSDIVATTPVSLLILDSHDLLHEILNIYLASQPTEGFGLSLPSLHYFGREKSIIRVKNSFESAKAFLRDIRLKCGILVVFKRDLCSFGSPVIRYKRALVESSAFDTDYTNIVPILGTNYCLVRPSDILCNFRSLLRTIN